MSIESNTTGKLVHVPFARDAYMWDDEQLLGSGWGAKESVPAFPPGEKQFIHQLVLILLF